MLIYDKIGHEKPFYNHLDIVLWLSSNHNHPLDSKQIGATVPGNNVHLIIIHPSYEWAQSYCWGNYDQARFSLRHICHSCGLIAL